MKAKIISLLWAVTLCSALGAGLVEAKELEMSTHANFVKMLIENDNRIPLIKASISYDEKVAKEINDGLRYIDLRTCPPPRYATQWASDEQWDTFSGKNEALEKDFVSFSWKMQSSEALGGASVVFFEDYETAKEQMLFNTVGRSNASFPLYSACKKEVGTVCVREHGGREIIFAYKNVMVSVESNFTLPDGSPLNEALALWVFEQLKKAPKVEALPTVLPPLEKEK